VAGIDFEGLFLNQSSKNLLTILRLDIEAPIDLMHKLLQRRKNDTTFRVINVSSMAAFYPMPHKAVYAASKRFLLDLSRALNMELQRENATVTVLCPAGMPTTPWCIQAIEAQGWAGQVTTMDVGRVAYVTLNGALKGKPVVIPGWINLVINGISTIIPTQMKMLWITSR
jgi:short-subunit dehydrogenase